MFNINCDKISSLDTTCTLKYIFTCLLLTIDCINIYLSCPSVYAVWFYAGVVQHLLDFYSLLEAIKNARGDIPITKNRLFNYLYMVTYYVGSRLI